MEGGDPLIWQLILQLVLIVFNALFAGTELAVISINDGKLAKLSAQGNKKAIRLKKLTEQPARFLSVIQVCITFAGFLGSAFAADNFSERLVHWLIGMGVNLPEHVLDIISVIVITLILSYITLILGELVPKRIAMRNAEKIGLSMSGLIYTVSKIFAPIVWLLTVSTNGILRMLGIDPNADEEEVTEEEIRLMVDVGSEKGAIDDDEREFIHNIFDFDDKTAEEVMTHRTDVTLLWMDESEEQWDKTINGSAFSFYPVCGDDVDDVVGILKVKDYFRLADKNREMVIKKAVKAVYFVPETVRTDVLFRNMKKTRNHFAVVMDEYGGMSGIITMNDLLEELVGDLEDDNSIPLDPPMIEAVDSQTWKIHGAADLVTVSERLEVNLPTDECDTFGGLVFSLLGSVPDDGSTPELEEFGLNIKVIRIKDHRLETALVCYARGNKL